NSIARTSSHREATFSLYRSRRDKYLNYPLIEAFVNKSANWYRWLVQDAREAMAAFGVTIHRYFIKVEAIISEAVFSSIELVRSSRIKRILASA
ncbi:hypothetical protein Tco_0899370, partial [Tanacetum coccineum]